MFLHVVFCMVSFLVCGCFPRFLVLLGKGAYVLLITFHNPLLSYEPWMFDCKTSQLGKCLQGLFKLLFGQSFHLILSCKQSCKNHSAVKMSCPCQSKDQFSSKQMHDIQLETSRRRFQESCSEWLSLLNRARLMLLLCIQTCIQKMPLIWHAACPSCDRSKPFLVYGF